MHRSIRPALVVVTLVVVALTAVACGSTDDAPTITEAAPTEEAVVERSEPVPEPEPEPEPVDTVAPAYPTTSPSTTTPPVYPVTEPDDGHHEALVRTFVDALNAGDLDAALAIAPGAAEPDWLSFAALEGPFEFEACFEGIEGSPVCHAAAALFALSFRFTDDGSAIAVVDGSYFEGL